MKIRSKATLTLRAMLALSLIHIWLDDWKGQQKEHEKPEKKNEQEK